MNDINKQVESLPTLQVMNFHGDEIFTFANDNKQYVAMRRIIENLGMSWGSQREKLKEQTDKFMCTDIGTHDSSGRIQQMLCMPVSKLPLWLASINPNKIKDEDRRLKIELYQEESAKALYDYWTKGVAIKGDLDGVVTDLDPKVMKALGGMFKAIVHKEIASIVPALVQQHVAEKHMQVVSGVTSSQVLDMAGIKDRKGMRGLSQKVSHRLRRFHALKGSVLNMGTLGSTQIYLYDPLTCREWLSAGGKDSIDHWVKEKRGQGRLTLVGSKNV